MGIVSLWLAAQFGQVMADSSVIMAIGPTLVAGPYQDEIECVPLTSSRIVGGQSSVSLVSLDVMDAAISETGMAP